MIGTDIIEIDRVARAAQNPKFVRRIFTPAEIAYIESKKYAPQTIAGLFAAKEAVVKALGTGFSGLSHQDIEITHTPNGAPQVILHKTDTKICISISHCKTYATATAILRE